MIQRSSQGQTRTGRVKVSTVVSCAVERAADGGTYATLLRAEKEIIAGLSAARRKPGLIFGLGGTGTGQRGGGH